MDAPERCLAAKYSRTAQGLCLGSVLEERCHSGPVPGNAAWGQIEVLTCVGLLQCVRHRLPWCGRNSPRKAKLG